MNNLRLRITTGIVYLALTISILLWGKNEFVILYLYFLSLLCFYEYLKINLKSTRFVEMLPSLLITPVVFSLVLFNQNSYISTGSYTYILLSSLFIPIVQQLFSKRQDPVHYLGVIYTGYILVIIPFAMLCQIANLEYPGSDINGLVPYTPIIVLVIFIFLWVSDSFAYVGGKLTGRTKLAPGISPGKTIEGLVSGLIMTNVSAFILSPYCYPFLSMNELIILANLCVISGLVGDLLISRFKRSLGIKDSGNSLPGHGGFLDRFDSLLIAAPAAYFYLRTILMFN